MQDLCKKMPKAELHLHLDGALNIKSAIDLAEAAGWDGFEQPLSYREMHSRLVVPRNLRSQEELLAYFEVPGILLHTEEALRRVTRELLLEKAADNVVYCEIRWAPMLHGAKGLSTAEVVAIVDDECRKTCALTGQTVRLIAVGMRTMPLETNLAMLEEIAPFAGETIAAVDFAGLESKNPDALSQKAYFARARELGFDITLHCGELPGSAPRLKAVVEEIKPTRIAHGPGSVEDKELCALLRERDVMLDLCPTSNIQAGLYPNHEQYPLRELVAMGVPVSVNTDDNVLSNLTLSDEYVRLLEAGQVDLPTLWRLNLDALRHVFLPDKEKARLIAAFESWATNVPELH